MNHRARLVALCGGRCSPRGDRRGRRSDRGRSTREPGGVVDAASAAADRTAVNLDTFDRAWTLIADTHWDPELGGLDWKAVRDELRPRAAAARSDRELREVIEEMLGRLGQSHFALLPGAAATPRLPAAVPKRTSCPAAPGGEPGDRRRDEPASGRRR